MELRDIVYKGANMKVGIKGDLKKNPVVFLHGNSLSGLTFQKQVEKLGIPLITIDLPGHGRSERPKDPEGVYSIPGYADAITHVLQELMSGKFILAGHSLGGHIAINAAPKLKDLKGLLIFGTPPLDSVTSLGNAFLPNPLFPLLLQDSVSPEQASQLAGGMLSRQEITEMIKKEILNTDPSARSHFGSFVAKGVIEDEVRIIRSRDFPVAILHGEHDSLINGAYIENLGFTNLWGNKVHRIADSGHCPQLEQPGAFNSLLTSYYNAIFS